MRTAPRQLFTESGGKNHDTQTVTLIAAGWANYIPNFFTRNLLGLKDGKMAIKVI